PGRRDHGADAAPAPAAQRRAGNDVLDGHARPARGRGRAAPAAAGKRRVVGAGAAQGRPGKPEGLTVWKFLPYVLKNLWRHRVRTALTVSGAAVALFVFCFVGAVREGLAGLTQRRQADRSLIVFQANRFCPFTSKLPEDYARTIAGVDGVADVVPVKVFMNNCRASL